MIPFDGPFAEKTVLPLAITAYAGTWNPTNNSILATFTDVSELCVDSTDIDFLKMAARPHLSSNSAEALAKMRAPAGANALPTSIDVAAAEGGTAADPTAPPPGPDPVPIALTPPVPLNDRFGWVCRDGDRLIVTFRGTQTPADWLHNLDFIGEPYLPVPGRGTVHQGFQLIYYAVRKNLLEIVAAIGNGCTSLLVTGHSLGGALATLAIPDLLNVLPNLSPILYNLAGPRTGHDDFQNFFDAHVNVCYRIVNVWDVVPHVPPGLAGYVHVGNQLTIDGGFNPDVVHNHVLSTGYAPGLAKWNLAHPVTQTPRMGAYGLGALVGVSA